AMPSGDTSGAIAEAAPALTPRTASCAARHSGHFGTAIASSTAGTNASSEAIRCPRGPCRAGSRLSAPASQHSAPILVPALDPGHRLRQRGLVAALGLQIEVMVGGVHHVDPTRVARVGVEDGAARVLVEHADAGPLLECLRDRRIVVRARAVGEVLRPERDLV